jgi:FdhD protein
LTQTRRVEVVSFRRGRPGASREARDVAGEAALVVEISGGATYTIMRTPGTDRELVAGFLFTEGLIRSTADILTLAECADDPNVVRVTLAGEKRGKRGQESFPHSAPEGPSREKTLDPFSLKRNLVVSSSCGLCGRSDVEALVASLPPVAGTTQFPLEILYELPGRVRSGQALFQSTGGTHAAALFDPRGQVLALREDLGRHNALDKVLGWALLSGAPLAGAGVFLTGRISLEMAVKAARAGIPLVAAASAPTAAAIELAERLGLTLCGFVRGDEVTVYTHPERVVERAAR